MSEQTDVEALREACEGWPTPNKYTAALDSLTAALTIAQDAERLADRRYFDAVAALERAEREWKRENEELALALNAEHEKLWKAGRVLGKFIAFQSAGYLAGQPFEETYAILVREARGLEES